MFRILRFDRKPLEAHPLTGFVLEYNKTHTLVQVYDDRLFQLNGWCVFLNADVRRYWEVQSDDLLARAARLRKLKPVAPDGVSIYNWKDVLTTAGAAFPLITIHRERIRRNTCWIGQFRRASQRSVTIRSISPQAQWEAEETFLLREITMVEFGGAYEELLSEFAQESSLA